MMNQREIAKEVLAVSLHIAEADKFNFEDSKKRMQLLTESVLKTNLLRQKPNKNCNQTVDLEFQQIDNLKDLLPHLAECSNLRELILHGNRLHTLPEDLSTLSTVETLDISNNLFDDIIPIIKALKTMPKLFHLHIGLRDKNEEKYVIQQLPNLITLNNRRLKFFDQLDSDRPSERQSARSEKSYQSEVTFNQEDVDNVENLFNQICNIENNPNQQKTYSPQLADHVKDVMTDFSTKVQQTHSKHFLDTHILKAKYDLYEICFRELIDYFRNNNNKLEQVLKTLQQEHSNIFNDLTNIIYNLRDYKKIQKESQEFDQLIQNSDVVKSQIKEIQLLKEERDRLLIDKNALQQQKDQQYELLHPLQLQVKTLQSSVQRLEQEKENLNNLISQLEYQFAQQQQIQRSNRGSSKQIQSANQSFQDMHSFSNFQTQQVVMLVKGTQTDNQRFFEKESQTNDQEDNVIFTKSIDMQSFQQELEDLQCQNEQLLQENKKYLEMIIRRSKVEKSSNIMSDISYKQTESPSIIEKKRYKTLSEFHLLVQPQSFRPLTLKQLKDIIQDIYESKTKHDIRQNESKLPLETIEQHMYTYLYCKYGLKNLALEWVACIINAIQKYIAEDNDVSVFALMLKNNIDEDFRFLQSQRKQNIEYIIQTILQAKYKTKQILEIKEMVKQKVAGQITQQEVIEILKCILPEEEKEILLSQLKMHQIKTVASVSPIKKVNQKEQRRPSAQKEPIKYEFSVFIKLILEYFMSLHQQYLSNLCLVFKSVDHDKDGILNQQQFQKLTETIKPNLQYEEYSKLYEMLDPFKNDKITFSQIVRVFRNPQFHNKNVDLIQQICII